MDEYIIIATKRLGIRNERIALKEVSTSIDHRQDANEYIKSGIKTFAGLLGDLLNPFIAHAINTTIADSFTTEKPSAIGSDSMGVAKKKRAIANCSNPILYLTACINELFYSR
jgi:hypothetical protein